MPGSITNCTESTGPTLDANEDATRLVALSLFGMLFTAFFAARCGLCTSRGRRNCFRKLRGLQVEEDERGGQRRIALVRIGTASLGQATTTPLPPMAKGDLEKQLTEKLRNFTVKLEEAQIKREGGVTECTTTERLDVELGHESTELDDDGTRVTDYCTGSGQTEIFLPLPGKMVTPTEFHSAGSNKTKRPSTRNCRNGRPRPGTCAICLEPYGVGDEVSWSSQEWCTHAFHSSCIKDYLVVQRATHTCPRPAAATQTNLLNSTTSGGDSAVLEERVVYKCPCCRQQFIQ